MLLTDFINVNLASIEHISRFKGIDFYQSYPFFSGGKFDISPTKNKALLNLYGGSFEQNSPFLEFEIMILKTKYNNLETFVVLILDIDSWLCVLDRSHPRLWLWW